jgi:hypothetical protein
MRATKQSGSLSKRQVFSRSTWPTRDEGPASIAGAQTRRYNMIITGIKFLSRRKAFPDHASAQKSGLCAYADGTPNLKVMDHGPMARVIEYYSPAGFCALPICD